MELCPSVYLYSLFFLSINWLIFLQSSSLRTNMSPKPWCAEDELVSQTALTAWHKAWILPTECGSTSNPADCLLIIVNDHSDCRLLPCFYSLACIWEDVQEKGWQFSFLSCAGALQVSRVSPLACWFSSMLYCFGGAVLSGIMLAEPPVAPLTNSTSVLLASIIW